MFFQTGDGLEAGLRLILSHLSYSNYTYIFLQTIKIKIKTFLSFMTLNSTILSFSFKSFPILIIISSFLKYLKL